MLSPIKQIKLLKKNFQTEEENFITIFGDSDFLIQQLCKELKESLKHKSISSISLEAKNETQESFEQKFLERDFFGEKTAYFISGLEQAKSFPKILEKIPSKAYFSSPLILIYKKNTPLANFKKEIKRLKSYEVFCKSPRSYENEEILRYLCDKAHLNLDREAFHYFEQKTGANLAQMENEVKKLTLILGESSKKRTLKEISKHIDTLEDEETFLLTSFLLEKKIEKAQAHVMRLISSGESPLSILGIITYFCRTALYLKTQNSAGSGENRGGNKIKLPHFLINRYNRYLGLHTEDSLKTVLKKCSESDLNLKTRGKNRELIFVSNVLIAFEE